MILIVDDEPADIRLYERLLKEASYNVLSTTSGEEALSILRNCLGIHLIFMDIVMPGISGIATTVRVRAMQLPQADLPIIGITGYDPEMHRDAHLLKAARFDGMLRKPLGAREILGAVLKWS